MKDEIKEILKNIKCPQFGSAKYGSWGSLPLKVRIALKKLCEYANACDDYITTLQEENENLKKRNKEIYDGFMATTQELTEYAEENEILKELNVCVGCNNNPDYKTRIDKALYWLSENTHYTSLKTDMLVQDENANFLELKDILQGDDK